jgi:hypothetical protein
VRRAPALSPTGPVRDYLFDHIHATMVSTRAGAGSSTTTRLGGWLYSSSMRAMPSTCVDKKTDVSDAQWLQAAMMPGKSKMTVTGQPARRGEGIDLGNGVRKTTLSPSDGVRVLWCVTRQYGRGGASGKSDGRVHPEWRKSAQTADPKGSIRRSLSSIRPSIGTENLIPEEMDHREIAVRVPVMNEVQFLFPPEPRKPLKPRSLYVVFLVEKDVHVERRRACDYLNHEEVEWQYEICTHSY